MDELPILSFEALLKETVWGGRRFAELLGRELPGSAPVGESWEVVDLPDDQSVVRGGERDGTVLADIRASVPDQLLGGAPLLQGRFPLLFKYLDAGQTLSVQVHPDEAACARLGDGARPKTEAWYIIDAQPGAVLYVGFVPGVDRQRFAAAIDSGQVEELLHRVEVSPGDFVFLPSGTVHAIGAGIVLAEVQQASDTTYRVFDWNRMGLDGKPRQLHVEQALESLHYDQVGVPDAAPPPSGRPGIACDAFVMESLVLADGQGVSLDGDGPLVLMGIGGGGTARIEAAGDGADLALGQTVLVPACRASSVEVTASGDTMILATRIPV